MTAEVNEHVLATSQLCGGRRFENLFWWLAFEGACLLFRTSRAPATEMGFMVSFGRGVMLPPCHGNRALCVERVELPS